MILCFGVILQCACFYRSSLTRALTRNNFTCSALHAYTLAQAHNLGAKLLQKYEMANNILYFFIRKYVFFCKGQIPVAFT